jgi:hypothetical protein
MLITSIHDIPDARLSVVCGLSNEDSTVVAGTVVVAAMLTN